MDSYSVVTSGLQTGETRGTRCGQCQRSGEAVWCPNCTPDTPSGLSKSERRWLDAQDQAPRRTSTDASRLHAAASKLQEHVASTVAAIANRTPTNPPPKGSGLGLRRGSEPSDPALRDIEATYDAVDLALTKLGHLFDDCPDCDGSRGHNDDTPTGAMLSGLDTVKAVVGDGRTVNVELQDLSETLTYLSCTNPHAVAKWLAVSAQAVVKVVDRIVEDWHSARNSGAEPDDLRRRVQDLTDLTSRARALRRSVAQWAPSEYQDRRGCKQCGGRVDDLPDTSHPRGGATCGPCRNAKWKDKQAG